MNEGEKTKQEEEEEEFDRYSINWIWLASSSPSSSFFSRITVFSGGVACRRSRDSTLRPHLFILARVICRTGRMIDGGWMFQPFWQLVFRDARSIKLNWIWRIFVFSRGERDSFFPVFFFFFWITGLQSDCEILERAFWKSVLKDGYTIGHDYEHGFLRIWREIVGKIVLCLAYEYKGNV